MSGLVIAGISIISIGLLGWGIQWLTQYMNFYLGAYRDLYFTLPHTTSWRGRLWFGVWFSLSGIAGIVFIYALLVSNTMLLRITTILPYCIIPIFPIFWLLAKPIWVRTFERRYTTEQILMVKEKGVALKQQYPKTFRKIIASRDGWEMWLLTVV